VSLDGDKMAALRQRFVAAAGEGVPQLEALIAAGDLEAVRGLAHSLAGRAGLFGFAELGAIARLADEADTATLPERARNLLTALRGLSPDD
jgi:HPt (histidine-containing phosphotransfer) domain-containing protein